MNKYLLSSKSKYPQTEDILADIEYLKGEAEYFMYVIDDSVEQAAVAMAEFGLKLTLELIEELDSYLTDFKPLSL